MGLVNGYHETLILHIIACLFVIIFVLLGSYVIYKLVDILLPIRLRDDQEERNLDLSQHGEIIN